MCITIFSQLCRIILRLQMLEYHKRELIYIVAYVYVCVCVCGGGGGGSGVYRAETTHQNRPKRPTLKSGQNDPGRNDPAETTHGRNDSCPTILYHFTISVYKLCASIGYYAANAQTILHLRTVSLEHTMLAYTKYGCRSRFRPKIRPPALLVKRGFCAYAISTKNTAFLSISTPFGIGWGGVWVY